MATDWIPYCGAAPSPAEWLARWNGDPVLIAALGLLALCGWRYVGDRRAFGGALAVLIVLFVSPFCAMTSALFAARAVHHVALIGVAAPLLASAFDMKSRHLTLATAVGAGTLLAWHLPALYDAALSNDAIYWAMTLALLAGATLFWAAIRAASAPAAVAGLLVTMVAMGLVGAILTFAGRPLYAPHLVAPIAWGFTPLEDQQLAGLVMWAPAGLLYMLSALAIAWRALSPQPARASA